MKPAFQTKSNMRAFTGAFYMLLGLLFVTPPADARGHAHSGARRTAPAAAPSTVRPVHAHPQPRYVHRARIYVAPISPWLAWPATVYPYTAFSPYSPPVTPTAPTPDDTLPPSPMKGAPGDTPAPPAPQFAPDGSGALYRPAE